VVGDILCRTAGTREGSKMCMVCVLRRMSALIHTAVALGSQPSLCIVACKIEKASKICIVELSCYTRALVYTAAYP
jgi:hypothetical protein